MNSKKKQENNWLGIRPMPKPKRINLKTISLMFLNSISSM